MRIAVLNWSNRVVGGTEEYLRKFLPAAATAGHAVGFWYETPDPPDRPMIPDPPAGAWSVAALGRDAALAALRAWQPDLVYAHGMLSPGLEEEAAAVAPTVFFVHAYYGTCISGTKTTQFPTPAPCNRRFGPACLAHYFPRRCGGLNPVTMLRQYRDQARRLAVLRGCAAVVTHSEHMRAEYVRNGLAADRVVNVPYYITDDPPDPSPDRPPGDPATILFLGRMEDAKGGLLLLDALPLVRAGLGRPVRAVFAGDGADRSRWEARAAELRAADPGLGTAFPGWVAADDRADLVAGANLVAVPSTWPEPFGRVGPEAGVHGVPVAAFAVGGTADWLTDGVNGFFAPGDPPTAAGLAEAILRCLADPATYHRLRAGAARLAGRFTWVNHYAALTSVFERVLGRPAAVGP